MLNSRNRMNRNVISVLILTLASVSGVFSQCSDLLDGCPGWKTFCGNYLYRDVFCRKSCGTCTPPGPSWTQWSPCSVTCGQGTQTRTRGSDTESRACDEGPCPGNGNWGNWGPFGGCSKQCGGGIQQRTRTCSSPGQCIGDDTESISCNQQPCPKCEDKDQFCTFYITFCPTNHYVRSNCQKTCDICPVSATWSDWSTYGPCSEMCGGGMSTRTRTCSVSGQCPGNSEESIPCNTDSCQGPVWSDWSAYGPCSKTCGSGSSTRTRTCSIAGQCSGNGQESILCETQSCPVPKWSGWSTYGPCSKTCGGGMSIRTRTCSIPGQCSGNSEESIPCNEQSCPVPVWGDWSNYGPCSRTCGGGSSTRTRTCSIAGQCSGSSEESISCNEQSCPVQCENSNGDFYCNTFSFWCSNPGFRNSCQKTCNACPKPSTGVWGLWSSWGACSKTCGGGESTRGRTCQSGQCSGDSSEKRACNTEECAPDPVWGHWTGWSLCDAECGDGQRTRTRECIGSNACVGPSISTKFCNIKDCDTIGTWGPWSPWGACSAECGGGERTRTRQCASNLGCGAGSSTEKEFCNTNTCTTTGIWQNWSSWGGCSVTCGGGVQTRTRVCNPGGCSGPATEERTCSEELCPVNWTPWTAWSSCSKECGGGESVRTRQCTPINANCPGTETAKRTCNDFLCLLSKCFEGWKYPMEMKPTG